MKELSLNILDIAMNSVKAKATDIGIAIEESENRLAITVSDNGTGMTKEIFENVTDPFTTTRTTRNVGLGIPFFKMEAEMTGGSFLIKTRHFTEYPDDHGTETTAVFIKDHLDFIPLGDIITTVVTLIQGNDEINWLFTHTTEKGEIRLDTRELKAVLGDVPLSEPDVLMWIREYLKEQYEQADYLI